MSHLRDRAAAFVDGQLTPESAERATAHLAGCRPCRDLVELERLTKARLAALQGPDPAPDLVGRLLAMGGPAGPLPPRRGHLPGAPRPQPVALPARVPAGAPGPVRVPLSLRLGAPGPRGAARPVRAAARPGTAARTATTVRSVVRPATILRERPSDRPANRSSHEFAGSAVRPRPGAPRPGRLTVAVLGALSVVGVGVAGVAAGSSAAASGTRPVPRVGTLVEPAAASSGAVVAPIDWSRGAVSGRMPLDRAVARR